MAAVKMHEGGTERGGINSGAGSLFGVPMGELGWFTSLLMGAATGFAAFFAATFVGIVVILFWNSAHGGSNAAGALDYTLAYRAVGLPVGLLVLVVALGYLGMLWVRRVFGRGLKRDA